MCAGFLLCFSLRKSKYHNLLSWLVGVYLVYVTPDKQKEKENRKLEAIQGKTGRFVIIFLIGLFFIL